MEYSPAGLPARKRAARSAHSHRVAGVDHVIVLHTAADKPQNMLHQ